jgi:ribosomal protein S18 acetylase RimI-like enzyme
MGREGLPASFQVSIGGLEDREDLQQELDLSPIGEEEENAADWRLNNARQLKGASLIRHAFHRYQPAWQTEHCSGCWAKFMEESRPDVLNEGYSTYTEYDWVCGNCYEELRSPMGWKLAPARVATLLTTGGLTIRHAHEENWIPEIRGLFLEYAQSLGIDLGFQDFDRELASLPGEYNWAMGKGCLLIALDHGKPVGCVGSRMLKDTMCEMKRLYVRPEARGTGAGEALARAIIDEARRLGYTGMRLDSLPFMERAIELYERLGFKRIVPYRHNPVEGTVFLELNLEA